MRPWVEAARARARVAQALAAAEDQGPALSLLREATAFASTAVLLAERERPLSELSESAIANCLEALAAAEGAPASLSGVLAAFSNPDPLALDALAVSQYEVLRVQAERVLHWLLGLAELRTPRELGRARWLRASVALLGGALVTTGLLIYWVALTALER